MKSGFKFLLFLFIFNILLLTSFAQDNNKEYEIKPLSISLYTGISIPVAGEYYWNNVWESGYLLGGNVFKPLNNRILVGIRANFNYWLYNEKALTKNYPSTFELGEIKGYAGVTEIVPSIRIILYDENNKSNLFLQFGAGYFNMQGNYSFSGTQYNDDGTITYPADSKKFQYNSSGLNLGLGIKAGKVEVFPLYSVIFTPHEPTNFISLNVGYHF